MRRSYLLAVVAFGLWGCPAGHHYEGLDAAPPDASPSDAPPPPVDAPPPPIDAPPPDAHVDAMPPPSTLTVLVGGNGTGHVVSDPAGIDCPGTCSAQFAFGTGVTLNETPSSSVFLGWSNDCSGTGICQVHLDADHTVGALFGIPGSNIWLDPTGASVTGTVLSTLFMSNGDVLVTGTFASSMTLGGKTTNGNGGFAARLKGATGAAVWITPVGDTVNAAAVDKNGDVIVGGDFHGTATLAGTSHTSNGNQDAFVLKLNGTTGAQVWAQTFGGIGRDSINGLAADSSSDVYIAGVFNADMITVGPNSFSSAGKLDMFLAKLGGTTNGSVVWSKQIGGGGTDNAVTLSIDGSNNITVGGTFASMVNFGGGAVTALGATDCFAAKYASANGAYLVAKHVGNANGSSFCVATVDAAGNIYMSGTFAGTLDVGGATPLMSVSSSIDIFLVKYSTAGSHQWSESFGNNQNTDIVNAISIDPSGNILVAGQFSNTISYGGGNLSAAGGTDIFVGHFKSGDGGYLSAIRLGGTGSELPNGVVGFTDHTVCIAGQYFGFSEFGGVAVSAPGGGSSYDGFALLSMPLD